MCGVCGVRGVRRVQGVRGGRGVRRLHSVAQAAGRDAGGEGDDVRRVRGGRQRVHAEEVRVGRRALVRVRVGVRVVRVRVWVWFRVWVS